MPGKNTKQECPWPIPPLVDQEEDLVWLAWIKELSQEDFDRVFKATRSGDDTSMRLIYELCGMEVLVHLVKNLLSTPLYISEAPINELRKIFIRRFYDPKKPETSIKVLSVRLRCSAQFVREALAEEPKEDPRQEKLKI